MFQTTFKVPTLMEALDAGTWLASNFTSSTEDLACKIAAGEVVAVYARSRFLPCSGEPRMALSAADEAKGEAAATDLVAKLDPKGANVPRGAGGIWLALFSIVSKMITEWIANR